MRWAGLLALWIGFFPLALSTIAAEPTTLGAEQVQQMLDRLAKTDQAQQQTWLRRLEARARRAAQIALAPDEAERQQARTHAQLHQKLVTWTVLRDVITETDVLERQAVSQLAKRYQTLVFDKFHDELETYGQRQQAWVDVKAAWLAAGAPFEEHNLLIDWLEAAIASISQETIGAVPDPPKFTPQSPSLKTSSPQKEAPASPEEKKSVVPEDISPRKQSSMPDRSSKETNAVADVSAETRPAASDPVVLSLPTESRVEPPSNLPAREVEADAQPGELPPDAVEVKIDQLAVRIAGCNLAIRALEADLNASGNWDAARLEPLVERLRGLAIRRNDLELFRQATPEETRNTLEALLPLNESISQAAGKVFKARQAVSAPDFKGTAEQRRLELERLDSLSRRLAELTRS